MAKAPKRSDEEQVTELIQKLEQPWASIVGNLRKTILSIDPEIGEQVKWNSPSFYYKGEMAPFDPKEYKRDIVVLNLHRNDHVLLVFPTGARIEDPAGLLEGKYTDGRKLAKISSQEEAEAKAPALRDVIKNWLLTVEKDPF